MQLFIIFSQYKTGRHKMKCSHTRLHEIITYQSGFSHSQYISVALTAKGCYGNNLEWLNEAFTLDHKVKKSFPILGNTI